MWKFACLVLLLARGVCYGLHIPEGMGIHTMLRISDKMSTYSELLRGRNVVPTIALNVLGATCQTFSIGQSFTPVVAKSSFVTVCMVLWSCGLNDILDYDLDRVYKRRRVLPSGKLSLNEAVWLVVGLMMVGYLSSRFLTYHPVTHYMYMSSSLLLLVYTPFLKRVPLLKNVVCSHVVASGAVYGGLSSLVPTYGSMMKLSHVRNYLDVYGSGFDIWAMMSPPLRYLYVGIFLYSLRREMYYDVLDVDGDLAYGVYTVPVLIGKRRTRVILDVLLGVSSMVFVRGLSSLFRWGFGLM